MRSIFSFILAFLIGLLACEHFIQKEAKQFSLRMSRMDCLGPCPVYTLIIDSGGRLEFEGIEFTEIKGKTESRLTTEQIKSLSYEIQKSNFFSLENDYSYDSKNCQWIETDHSSAILTIQFNGNKKTINHYQGCIIENRFWETSPLERLAEFEDKIDEIVETKRWIGEV